METVLSCRRCEFTRDQTDWFLSKSRKLDALMGEDARIRWTIKRRARGYRVLGSAFGKNVIVQAKATAAEPRRAFREAFMKIWRRILKQSRRIAARRQIGV